MPDQHEADTSRTTAEFRAFVGQFGGPENTQPWAMRASRSRVAVLAAAVLAVAVVLAVLALIVLP
jgi:hypothetical protein